MIINSQNMTPIPTNWPRQVYKPEDYSAHSDWPKITLITPSFQQGKYIEDTILSVLNQGYPNLEYIIVDGGSTDETVTILKKYADKLTWWVSEKDKGQSDAINKGLTHATGEIFNWLCSDDMLMPGALKSIALAFLNPDTNIVCGWSRQFSESKDYGLACTTLYASIPEIFYVSHICQPATWFRMELFRKMAPLNIQLHYAMDSELWLQYLIAYGRNSIQEIPSVITAYRYHDASKTISLDYKFREDKLGLIYSILKVFKAPLFLCKTYQPFQRTDFHTKSITTSIHSDLPVTDILEYFTLEAISFSKVKRKYWLLICLLFYLVWLKPGRNIEAWKRMLKSKIAPKLFRS